MAILGFIVMCVEIVFAAGAALFFWIMYDLSPTKDLLIASIICTLWTGFLMWAAVEFAPFRVVML